MPVDMALLSKISTAMRKYLLTNAEISPFIKWQSMNGRSSPESLSDERVHRSVGDFIVGKTLERGKYDGVYWNAERRWEFGKLV